MRYPRILLLTVLSVLVVYGAYRSATRAPDTLAPEGCRMSRMWPSYVHQTDFNKSWSAHASRYSLWLYREAGWDSPHELRGVPVLFIPGNAGSSRQARSIASSATHQYYSSRDVRSNAFPAHVKPLDVFTAEFNEDFSAFHGPTLMAQSRYVADAVNFILSRYPVGTQVVLMGHSMGGIVAMSQLPSTNISAIITMSTPHSLPPARFDRRIEDIFATSWKAAANSSTPVLSICGGATDLMIPSEYCHLPMLSPSTHAGYRKSIFTSGMEGVWTGVGHQSMVWCHQVRWRVARAGLLIGGSPSPQEIGSVFDTWFRTSVEVATTRDAGTIDLPAAAARNIVKFGDTLLLRPPSTTTSAYIFAIPSVPETELEFTLLASRAVINGLTTSTPARTKIQVLSCTVTTEVDRLQCDNVEPKSLRLLPMTRWANAFPLPNEGAAESDGIIAFRAVIHPDTMLATSRQLVMLVEHGTSDAWVVATLDASAVSSVAAGANFDPKRLVQSLELTRASSSLFAYRLVTELRGTCSNNNLFPPLLHLESSAAEAHFYSLQPGRDVVLHSHTHGPFLARSTRNQAPRITVYASGDCGVSRIAQHIDWYASIGQWALRFWGAVATWAVGIVAVVTLRSSLAVNSSGELPDFLGSLEYTASGLVPGIAGVIAVVSILPLPLDTFLGISGTYEAVLISIIVFTIAFAYVVVLGAVAKGISIGLGFFKRRLARYGEPRSPSEKTDSTYARHTPPAVTIGRILSISGVLLLVAFVIPHQVAYVVVLVDFVWSCAMLPGTNSRVTAERQHVLVILLALFPLQAPVLPVWIRTLLTAGYTTPFDGDHNILLIAPLLLLAGFAPSNPRSHLWSRGPLTRIELVITSVLLGLLASYSIVFGFRWMFGVYEIANMLAGWVVILLYASPWRKSI